jgi:hypothetical protein
MASLALGVKFNPASAGTADFVYASAVGGYVGPAATSPAMVDGKTYRYRAESADLTQWEFGYGIYTAAAQTLARSTIQLSSTGAKVSFTVPPQVGVTAFPADVLLYDDAMSLTSAEQSQARANLGIVGRNKIINGGFAINQRGYVSASTLASGTYAHDRWKAGASGGDYSFVQIASPTQVTIAAGKSLIQVIENVNVEGGTYILSWTGTATGRIGINSATPSGNFSASPVIVTGQTAGTVMSVEFTGANAAGGNSVATNSGTLGTVQLETGSVASPFEFRSYPAELAYCQRYYAQIGKALWCFGFNNTSIVVGASFPVAMRGTATISNPVALTVHDLPVGTIVQSGANQINAGPYVDGDGFYVGIGGFSGITVYRPYAINGGYVAASSEL